MSSSVSLIWPKSHQRKAIKHNQREKKKIEGKKKSASPSGVHTEIGAGSPGQQIDWLNNESSWSLTKHID